MTGPVVNIWKLLDLFSQFIFSCVVGASSAMEVFIALSAFIGGYKCMQIYHTDEDHYWKKSIYLIGRKLLRIIPLFYFIFFAGWVCGAFLQSGPQWYLYQSLYQDCDRYWWAQLLFIGNWVPFFEDGNRGCFFWGFGIYCDVQLFLLVPLLVRLYLKSKKGSFIVFYSLIALNMITNMLIAWKYDLKAGPLALENYYMFSYLMYKPYSRVAQVCLGVQCGILYFHIL